MESLHSLDDFGVHLKDDLAFFSGMRVNLECISIDGTSVIARTTSKSVPMAVLKCDFPVWVASYMDVGRNFSVVDFELCQYNERSVIKGRKNELFPIFHTTMQHRAVAEAFAGLGGWSVGSQWCGVEPVLLVEQDHCTAEACAKSHHLDRLNIESAMLLVSQLSLPDRFVLQADVNDIRTHVIASIMGVVMWLASPPCQPWSRAGWQRGIETDEGASFVRFVYLTGLSTARCMNLENVPGLPDHNQYELLKQALHEAGWSLEVSHVDQVFPLLPVMRQRWLATCVRYGIPIMTDMKNRVISMGIPENVPFFGRENSIAKFGCVHKDVPEWFRDACMPSDEAYQAMCDPNLLPKKHRTPEYMKMDKLDVLALRVISSRRPLPNVMANQGSQHLLPQDLLRDKGLHAFLLCDGDILRFVSPFEISFAMGFPSTIQLPVDFALAWRMVGNSLSIPHATLQCLRSHYLLGPASVFTDCLRGPFALCDKVLQSRCIMTDFRIICEDGWMSLSPLSSDPVELPDVEGTGKSQIGDMSVPALMNTNDEREVIPISDDEHQSKRVCISPTWQLKEGEPRLVVELCKSDFPNCKQHTIGVSKPEDGGLNFASLQSPGDFNVNDCMMMVQVLHTQGIWGISKLIPKGLSVLEILQCFLPHAKQEHFDNILVNGWVARCGSVLVGVNAAMIQVRPFGFLRIAQAPFLQCDLPIEVDAMWNFRDLAAFVAAEAAILVSQISLATESRLVNPDEFVLAHDVGCFQAKIQPVQMDIDQQLVGCKKRQELQLLEVPFQAPQCNDNATPAHGNTVRFTTRHPKFGTVRTITVTKDVCVETVIDLLLPGFSVDNQPKLVLDECIVDNDVIVASIGTGNLELFFPGDKPWPCVTVLRTFAFGQVDKSGRGTVVRDVKGPFDYRAKSMKVCDDFTVLQLVASFLDLHCSNLTIIVLQGGKSVDARIQVASLPDDMPIEIRVCGLPGGAKSKPDVSKKLADMLVQQGVPESAKTDRTALITSKIPQSELVSLLAQDEKNAWIALKKKANECKIRLITSQELQAFQKKQRKDKPENKAASSSSGKRKISDRSQLDPNRVFIDPTHFRCSGTQPATIKVAQWGPDAKGLAIANRSEAAKLMPVSRLSADGLALLVLTDQTFDGKQPFTMPATDEHANPILASGVLLNFGDDLIEYKPSLPGAELGEVPTATLEVTIQRSLVPKWQDVQNPLNYLGLQLPEIRNEQVIQSWSFKPYTNDRTRCKHDDATYVHGFVKIPESLLSSTLQRSGLAGVFLQVKGPDRKHCPRFGVIAMHGKTLDEVVKQAMAINDVLGVVQLSQPNVYGLRARREHLAAIRRQALPQGIAIQEGEIPPDANWWVLKNVTASTTCGALTAALKTLGWDASAIRPGGKNAWIVCSSSDPPATHLCLNSDYAAVVPLRSRIETSSAPSLKSSKADADFSMCPEEDDVPTVASRMSCLKTDLEDRLTSMINERIKKCDEKIADVHASVEAVQHEVAASTEQTKLELDVIKEQQNVMQSRLGSFEASFESSFNASNSALMSQMQGLFQQMQTSLNTRLDALEPQNESEIKRRKGEL